MKHNPTTQTMPKNQREIEPSLVRSGAFAASGKAKMQVHRRQVRLYGDHTVDDPFFERIVVLNEHFIGFREYASGREECTLNRTVIAADSIDDLNRNLSSSKALEMFDDLTGMNTKEWDRLYRRMWWRDWQSTRLHWWLDVSFPSRKRVDQLNHKYLRYVVTVHEKRALGIEVPA